VLAGEYAPSSVDWVREEVAHLERTGAAWGGRPVVVLTTVGARTGLLRKTPLMRVEHQGSYAVVASRAGADVHPDWYANLLAQPSVDLRDGAVTRSLRAREITGAERARWWSRACTVFPSYADYQSRTRRRIPVVLLEDRRQPDGTSSTSNPAGSSR
jgi:deazaflavin-dependent oxidoreductase (nitroreductase family)